ncbi:MerR family transcriptional regulator (modular protein) [Verrucomicrobia bacterium]|nr:MerR family transcriptional regulator (modular protein) [Verrucomicrobiota bacterium]
MNITEEVSVRELQLFEPDPDAIYTIEAAANLAQVGRHRILVYYKQGLVSPVVAPECGGYYFNDEGVRTLRRIDYLHTNRGINLEGTRMILQLQNEVERLRSEVRFLLER